MKTAKNQCDTKTAKQKTVRVRVLEDSLSALETGRCTTPTLF